MLDVRYRAMSVPYNGNSRTVDGCGRTACDAARCAAWEPEVLPLKGGFPTGGAELTAGVFETRGHLPQGRSMFPGTEHSTVQDADDCRLGRMYRILYE